MALAIASAGSAIAEESSAPEITAVSPDHGPRNGGNSVVITGANFTGATDVYFGLFEAESFTVVSDGEITATAPSTGGPGEGLAVVGITVTGPDGTSRETPADRYGYGPVIDEIKPGRGPAAGGTAVTLFGYGLEETSAVNFGSVPAQSFTVNPDGSVIATSPPIVSDDPIMPITATTPEGTTENFDLPGQEVMPANFFTYGPTVTSVTPDEGPAAGGTQVTIHGTGFQTSVFFCLCGPFVPSVTFGAESLKCGFPPGAAQVPCSPVQFEVKSETEIVATTPPGNGTIDVGVFTEGGPSPDNPAAHFTYVSEPSPKPAPESGSQLLQLLNCAPSGHQLRHRGVAKVCSSRSVKTRESGLASGPSTARLRRGQVLFAKGSAISNRNRLRLRLSPLRSVKPGRYVLTLARPGINPRRESIVIR